MCSLGRFRGISKSQFSENPTVTKSFKCNFSCGQICNWFYKFSECHGTQAGFFESPFCHTFCLHKLELEHWHYHIVWGISSSHLWSTSIIWAPSSTIRRITLSLYVNAACPRKPLRDLVKEFWQRWLFRTFPSRSFPNASVIIVI